MTPPQNEPSPKPFVQRVPLLTMKQAAAFIGFTSAGRMLFELDTLPKKP